MNNVSRFSQRQANIWHSPLVFLIGALYAGVFIGEFIYALSDIRSFSPIIDKMADLGCTFVLFINASSLIMFYSFIVEPLEFTSRDYGVTAAGTFLVVIVYLITFFAVHQAHIGMLRV